MTRAVVAPKGAAGGGAGKPAQLSLNGEAIDPLRLKRLAKGDSVVVKTAGGGGFGEASGD